MNDDMASYISSQLIKAMIKESINIESSRVLVMGLTFKEDCPDFRNTKVLDMIHKLEGYKCIVDVYDPVLDSDEVKKDLDLIMCKNLVNGYYDAIVLAVAHSDFKKMGISAIKALLKPKGIIYDLKYIFPADDSNIRL